MAEPERAMPAVLNFTRPTATNGKTVHTAGDASESLSAK